MLCIKVRTSIYHFLVAMLIVCGTTLHTAFCINLGKWVSVGSIEFIHVALILRELFNGIVESSQIIVSVLKFKKISLFYRIFYRRLYCVYLSRFLPRWFVSWSFSMYRSQEALCRIPLSTWLLLFDIFLRCWWNFFLSYVWYSGGQLFLKLLPGPLSSNPVINLSLYASINSTSTSTKLYLVCAFFHSQ